SNSKVMIQAYRLLTERMAAENMHYPLHLGVTEAGDGEDGRIKSAIGIGSLLLDGLGDTIRVSLTEDSVYEIPVARAIADKAMSLWGQDAAAADGPDGIDPYHFSRRNAAAVRLAPAVATGPEQPPRVVVRARAEELPALKAALQGPRQADTPAEGLLLEAPTGADLGRLAAAVKASGLEGIFVALELGSGV